MVVLESEAGDGKPFPGEEIDKDETKSSPLLSLESILFVNKLTFSRVQLK